MALVTALFRGRESRSFGPFSYPLVPRQPRPDAGAVPAPPPDTLTDQDAEQLLAAIYAALTPHALYRLTLRECEPDHERQLLTYQLEVVCDTGAASTPPVALSSEAWMALQRQEFRMLAPRVVKLGDWHART